MSREDGELLLCVWDFFDYSHKIIGEPVLGFDDILRGIDSRDPSDNSLPSLGEVYFDEVSILFTQFLLRELRVRMGFDGVRRYDSVTCESEYMGYSTARMRVDAEMQWQELLLYRPLNAMTWPNVLRTTLQVVAPPQMSVDTARVLAKLPGTGPALIANEIMAVLCSHPAARHFLDRSSQVGVVMLNETKETGQKKSLQGMEEDDASTVDGTYGVGCKLLYAEAKDRASFEAFLATVPTSLSQLRDRCQWSEALYQGRYYPTLEAFQADLMGFLFMKMGLNSDHLAGHNTKGNTPISLPECAHDEDYNALYCARDLISFYLSFDDKKEHFDYLPDFEKVGTTHACCGAIRCSIW